MAWHGMAWHSQAWHGMAYTARPGVACHGMAWPDGQRLAGPGMTHHDMAWPSRAWQCHEPVMAVQCTGMIHSNGDVPRGEAGIHDPWGRPRRPTMLMISPAPFLQLRKRLPTLSYPERISPPLLATPTKSPIAECIAVIVITAAGHRGPRKEGRPALRRA